MVSCVAPSDAYYDAYGTTMPRYLPSHKVHTLPNGYHTEKIGDVTYYYDNGEYFRPHGAGYVVVEAPRSSRYYGDYRRRHSLYD